MLASPRRPRAGFTLVELLVVIGIIALLVGILLPSLAKAKRSAITVKCLANMKSLGQACMVYANDNKGAILPTYVWGGGGGGYGDPWAFLLVQGHYLPDPRITSNGSIGAGSGNSVLMCPAVRDVPATDNTANPVYATSSSVGVTDGYYRTYSRVLMPNATDAATHGYVGYTPPEPVTNSPVAQGACILDIGYGVNGATDANSYGTTPQYLPMQATTYWPDHTSPHKIIPTYRLSQFPRAAQTVMMFDGSQWNAFATGTNHMWRIVGARHGNWHAGGVNPGTGHGNLYDFSSGIVNTLFLDGHAASVGRGEMPCEPVSGGISTQMTGDMSALVNKTVSPYMSNAYLWNKSQQH